MTLHPEVLKAFEHLPDPYLILSPGLYIITASDAYLHATFTRRADIQGKFVFDVFPDNPGALHANGVKNLQASLQQVLDTGRPHQMALQRYDVRRSNVQGSGFEEKLWNPTNTPVLDAGGRVQYIIHKVIDVTDVIRTEQQLEALKDEAADLVQVLAQSNRELKALTAQLKESNQQLAHKSERLLQLNTDLDNFTYTISHDLRGYVANLQAIVELQHRSLKRHLPEKEKGLLDLLAKVTDKLKAYLDKLSSLVAEQKKLDAGPIEMVALQPLLEEIKHDFSEQIESHNARLVEQFEVAAIPFARAGLRSIFYNLISNALKYRAPARPPMIKLRTYRQGDAVVLEVSDNGRGIPKGQQQKLFSIFKRFHPDVEGSGVGLYMLKRMIQNRGGSLAVESQEDQGTTFRVCFPATPQQ